MKIKIQSNFNNLIMELIIYAIFIVQFLPLVNVFGKLVVNGISLLLLIAFLVVVLCINRRLSVEFLVILSISILYNLYCYHQCWRKYTSFWGFMIENTMCWGMILVGLVLFGIWKSEAKTWSFSFNKICYYFYSNFFNYCFV